MTKDAFKTVVAKDNSAFGTHYYGPYTWKDKKLKNLLKKNARSRITAQTKKIFFEV